MKIFKRGSFVAILVGFTLLVVPVRGEEPAWSLEGKVVTADNCSIGCPCIFGEAPTHGHCSFVGIFEVTEGNYSDTNLGGTRFGVAGEFVRQETQAAQEFRYVAFYIDSQAGEKQSAALRKILTGPTFAGMGKPAEVKEVPIMLTGLEKFGQFGKTYGGTLGEIAKVEVTPIEGAIAGKPLVIENSKEPLFHWTCLGKASGSFYSGGGQNFRFEGTSGESHKFAFKGGSGSK